MSGVKVFTQHVVDDVSKFSFLLDLNRGVFDFEVKDIFLGAGF